MYSSSLDESLIDKLSCIKIKNCKCGSYIIREDIHTLALKYYKNTLFLQVNKENKDKSIGKQAKGLNLYFTQSISIQAYEKLLKCIRYQRNTK
jgi:hypothetical protein